MDIEIGVDDYLDTMYNLMREGWFITKRTESKKAWTYEVTNREKKTRKVIVTKPI